MNVTKDKISSVFFQYSIPSVLGMLAISSANIVGGFIADEFYRLRNKITICESKYILENYKLVI